MKLQKFLYTLSVLLMLPMMLLCIMGLFKMDVTPQQVVSAGMLLFFGIASSVRASLITK